jgi:hypothetical protein
MRKKSATTKTIKKNAADMPAASDTDVNHLRKAMDGPIDTSDIAEHRGRFDRLKRDSNGRLPRGPVDKC